MHLRHHWVGHCPEGMHGKRHWYQEENDKSSAPLGFIAKQDTQSSKHRHESGNRNQDVCKRDTLRCREANNIWVEVAKTSHDEDDGEENATDKGEVLHDKLTDFVEQR